ncbi:MAG: hypothetical protein HQK61_12045, partial [Desulfamplus sp.]|nr:hypothetical protein [Desulfamplus sp.]
MEIRSQALKVNLEETRVDVEIDGKYKIILDVFERYQGLHSELVIFLKELSNPMRNWQFIISDARRHAFDHIHIMISHACAKEVIGVFLNIFHDAIEANQENDSARKGTGWFQTGQLQARTLIQAEAVDSLMRFVQKIIKASGKNLAIMVPVFNETFRRISRNSDRTLLLFSKSYYRLNRIVSELLRSANLNCGTASTSNSKTFNSKTFNSEISNSKTSNSEIASSKTSSSKTSNHMILNNDGSPDGTDIDWKCINTLLFRYHKTAYQGWLKENDPLCWFEQEIEAMVTDRNKTTELPDKVKELFAPISHERMKNELDLLSNLKQRCQENQERYHSISITMELTRFPENNEIINLYKAMPAKLLEAGSTSRQGNHWKVLFLFHILNIPDLSMIHIATFQDINNTLRWLIGVENTPYLQQLVRQTFTILKLRSE